MLKIKKALTEQISNDCPKCVIGSMYFIGIMYTGASPVYDYVCINCGQKQKLYLQYSYSI